MGLPAEARTCGEFVTFSLTHRKTQEKPCRRLPSFSLLS